MRPLIDDAHGLLLRGVRDILSRDPALKRLVNSPALTVGGCEAERWASATFTGQRHRLHLTLRGTPAEVEAARAAIALRLPGAEFDLRGHLVADIAMTGAETSADGVAAVCEMTFEALTVED